jgi:hypothetical protein
VKLRAGLFQWKTYLNLHRDDLRLTGWEIATTISECSQPRLSNCNVLLDCACTGSYSADDGTFTPVRMSEKEAESVFRTIFSAGLKALATHLKRRSPG